MTPAQDNRLRRHAQHAYDFASAELKRTDIPDFDDEDPRGYMARLKAHHDSPEYRDNIAYRESLHHLRAYASYRRHHPLVRLLKRSQSIGHVERNEYGEPGARFHWYWQNLDKDLQTRDSSPSIIGLGLPDIRHEGRAWFDWHIRATDRHPLKIEVDWATGKAVWSSGVSVGRSSGGTVTLHAAIRPLASVYLIFKHLLPRIEDGTGRTYSVSIAESALHWDLGKPGSGDEWHRNDPLNWMRGCRFLVDDIFGRAKCETVQVGPKVQAIASFPEGDYPLLLQREIRTWKHPRWPWPMTRRSVDIEAVRAAESQGKGENSWDCGPDAIWGMSSSGHSYEDAVAAYVKATLRDRAKRGHISEEHRAVMVPA